MNVEKMLCKLNLNSRMTKINILNGLKNKW